MKKSTIKRALSLLVCTVILFTSAFTLISCFDPGETPSPSDALTKEELINTVQSATDKSYTYVSTYLEAWGLPKFDTQKFKSIEVDVFRYYVDGREDPFLAAKKTVINYVDNYYDITDPENKTEVTDALINSYVYSLGDDYAIYRTADEYEEYQTDMSGTFVGIGVTIEYNRAEGTMLVISIIDDSPAERAGFKTGDYIIGVDGKSIAELGYDGTVNSIRGEIGTTVTVRVLRGNSEIDLVAIRAKITEQTVTYKMLDNAIAYVRITQFKANTAEQFKAAMLFVSQNNAQGVIFDLRSNPGGYLQSVLDVIECLVPEGKRMASYIYAGYESVFTSSKPDKLNVPCVVLCNEYTASAGELFTAAVRDYAKDGVLNAKIVGVNTFGKGIMQSTYSYTDNSSLTMTVAYYYPPSNVNYHGKGIAPDRVVQLTETDTEDVQLLVGIEEIEKLIP